MYLMYVDESGDAGIMDNSSEYFILSGLVIHELRWTQLLDDFIQFRRSVKQSTGFKLREEMHAQIMINGRLDKNNNIQRNQRFMILRNTIDWIASQDSVGIMTVVVSKKNFTDPKDVFEFAWRTLIQRYENTINSHNFPGPQNTDDRGIIIADNTNGEILRNLHRKMRRYNPVPSKYTVASRNLPIKLIIEDPVFRDSKHSYFIQIVDIISYFTAQYIKPNKIVKKQGAKTYFERLDPVFVKKAAPLDPYGRVWVKK